MTRARLPLAAALLLTIFDFSAWAAADQDASRLLPTGKRITPLATPGSTLVSLNPGLKDFPHFVAGQAISTAVSPGHRILLVLTSGFNRNNDANGKVIDDASEEYVFVYDISTPTARQTQVLKVPDTFAGIAFAPDGKRFFVSGGKDDNVHTYSTTAGGAWMEDATPIALGHTSGLGFTPGKEPLAAGGLAVTPDGNTAVIANVYNDSISIIDLKARRIRTEVDLRPGKENRRDRGIAGGEYPFWVAAKSGDEVYVSSIRDREVDDVRIGQRPAVLARIKVPGNPNKMVLEPGRLRLFVAEDNSDVVTVIDTNNNRTIENIIATAPLGY